MLSRADADKKREAKEENRRKAKEQRKNRVQENRQKTKDKGQAKKLDRQEFLEAQSKKKEKEGCKEQLTPEIIKEMTFA